MATIDRPPASEVAASHPPRRSYFREVPWRRSDVLIGFAPVIAIRLESVVLSAALLAQFLRLFWLAQAVISLAWMATFPLAIGRRRLGRWPRLPRARTIFFEALLALVAGFAILLIIGPLQPYLARLAGETEMPPNPVAPMARSPDRFVAYGFMVAVLILAPIGEELLFRGLLYNALRQRLHWIVAIPLQALAFGVLHPFDLANSAAVAIIGLGLGALYEWRKTLLAPVLMHALTNGIALLAITFGLTPEANAPRLGVYGSANDKGCLITQVVPGSSADLAGLTIGDVVTTFDGKPVSGIASMARIVRKKHEGDMVTVEFLRDGEPHRVDAVLHRLVE